MSPGVGPRPWTFTARFVLVGLMAAIGLLVSACTSNRTPHTGTGTTPTASTAPSSSTTLTASTLAVAVSTTSVPVESPPSTPTPIDGLELTLTEAGAGFDAPVLLVADPDGGADLVVEQSGRIVRNDDDHTVALDITGDVMFDGEQGLLGLAFHPETGEAGRAYVNYVDRSGSTVIEEFQVNAGVFDVETRRRILTIDQPARNHNGGMLAFGPEGYLWIGMGDGGGADDRFKQGQDPTTLLGSMLRIDVDSRGSGEYGVPPDNPYADGSNGAPEVWAIGLRNPWRFSFDGDVLWIADVGQSAVEEVNLVNVSDAGGNLGWPVMEGSTCFENEGCDPTPFVAPIDEYGHDEGCSVTGGYVYRGSSIPELHGQYFYSDFCSGFLRSRAVDGSTVDWTDQVGGTRQVSGFGIGGDGELYVVSLLGVLYRLEEAS